MTVLKAVEEDATAIAVEVVAAAEVDMVVDRAVAAAVDSVTVAMEVDVVVAEAAHATEVQPCAWTCPSGVTFS